MSPRLRAALLLAGVFAAGLGFGSAATVLVVRHRLRNPPPGGLVPPRVVHALVRDLDLDAAQKAKVTAIVDETRNELVGVADRAEPEVTGILLRARDRIRTELRPEQRERFDREVRRRLERWREIRARLHGGKGAAGR